MWLALLMTVAFTIQYLLDRRHILAMVDGRPWTELGVLWTPWASWASSSRWERMYLLTYRDEDGRLARRRCRVVGKFGGSDGVFIEPLSQDLPKTPLPRWQLIPIAAFVGAWIGAALGIGGSMIVLPGSNVAPAYGLIVMAPIGLLGGLLFGAVRGR